MCHEKSNGTFDMHKSGSYQHSQIHHRPLNFCNEDTVQSYDGSNIKNPERTDNSNEIIETNHSIKDQA